MFLHKFILGQNMQKHIQMYMLGVPGNHFAEALGICLTAEDVGKGCPRWESMDRRVEK